MILTSYVADLELAASENKAHAEFQVGGGNEQENKVLLNWFKAFAECQLALSEARLIYVRSFSPRVYSKVATRASFFLDRDLFLQPASLDGLLQAFGCPLSQHDTDTLPLFFDDTSLIAVCSPGHCVSMPVLGG